MPTDHQPATRAAPVRPPSGLAALLALALPVDRPVHFQSGRAVSSWDLSIFRAAQARERPAGGCTQPGAQAKPKSQKPPEDPKVPGGQRGRESPARSRRRRRRTRSRRSGTRRSTSRDAAGEQEAPGGERRQPDRSGLAGEGRVRPDAGNGGNHLREPLPGRPVPRVGRRRHRRQHAPGVHDRRQRRRGRTVSFKVKSTAPATGSTSTASATTRARRPEVDSFIPRPPTRRRSGLPRPRHRASSTAATGRVGLLDVPATRVSGVYLARLVRLDNGGASHVVFVVRDDASRSASLVPDLGRHLAGLQRLRRQQPVRLHRRLPAGQPEHLQGRLQGLLQPARSTPAGHAGGQRLALHGRVPDDPLPRAQRLRRQLHDRRRRGPPRCPAQATTRFSSPVGHDEYWSGGAAGGVEAARDAGVDLAFFSGNEVFWKTRWEASIGRVRRTAYRTLVTYKETHFTTPQDPPYPTIGPAPGATPASARRRTAGARRTP